MATATANGNKKRKLAHKPATSATNAAATAVAVASAKAQGLLVSDLGFVYTSEEKMQCVEQVTMTAKEVMIQQLTTDLSYDVTDAEYERLVQLTQAHPSFKQQYTFPYDEATGWVRPSSKKKKSHLRVVAIDCEMCVTVNVETNQRTSSALIRVSAVDGDDMIRNLLADFIVHQPEEGTMMHDPKTDIHGISMAMIEQSKISVTKAQKRMLKYINADTIVVGHSVSGDLASLRIDHQRVIDTAMLFSRIGVPANARGSTPGLRCLTKFLLKFEMPNGHDSTIDAQASMLAAKYAARNPIGAIIPPAHELHGKQSTRSFQLRAQDRPRTDYPPQQEPVERKVATVGQVDAALEAFVASKLYRLRLRRIPIGVTIHDIAQFFATCASAAPVMIEAIQWPRNARNRGSCCVTFESPEHASLAFSSVTLPPKAGDAAAAKQIEATCDSIGQLQKQITVTNNVGTEFDKIMLGLL